MVFEGTSRPESMPDTETTFRRWSEGEIVGIDAQQVDGTTFGGILSVVLDGGSWTSTDGTICFNSATSATLVLRSPCRRAERVRETTVPRVMVETDDRLRRDAPPPPPRASTPHVDVRLHASASPQTGVDAADAPEAADPSASEPRRAAGGIRSVRVHLELRARGMASQPPGCLERGLRAGLVLGLPQRRERSIDVLAGAPRRRCPSCCSPCSTITRTFSTTIAPMPVAYSDVAGSSSRSARARTDWCFRSAGSTGPAQPDGSPSPTTSTGSTPGIARSSQDAHCRSCGRWVASTRIS